MTQKEWSDIFASNLNDILEEKGMSQAQLARDAELSKSRVNDYINGNAVPTAAALINMAYALDMDLGDFMDFGERVSR